MKYDDALEVAIVIGSILDKIAPLEEEVEYEEDDED
jgi:hypothetical protein